MLTAMTTSRGQVPAPQKWGPLWARVLAWIVLVPAALGLILGVRFIVQGFGPETLAAVGLIVGPLLILLVLAIAVPALFFLRRGGKTPFFIAVIVTAASTALVLFAFL